VDGRDRIVTSITDVLPTGDGWVVLKVNPVAGFLDIFGEASSPPRTPGSPRTPRPRLDMSCFRHAIMPP
jgi:hypothetical protein